MQSQNSQCESCGKIGHFESVCRSKTVRNIDGHESEDFEDKSISDTNYTDVFFSYNYLPGDSKTSTKYL